MSAPPRRPIPALGLVLLLLLSASGCSDAAAPADGRATVRSVIDGDTIVVDYGPHHETVRLLGIDTPETHHPDRPIECFGEAAAARLTELLPASAEVELARDREARDRYGRLLAWVRRSDGLDVQGTLVDEGAADVLAIEPNTARRAELRARRDRARAERRGLWGACAGPHVPAGSVGADREG